MKNHPKHNASPTPLNSVNSTGLIHHPYQPPADFASPVAPVYKGSTIFFPDMDAVRSRDWTNKSGYTYGLHGTPTSFLLEERLAYLENAKYCALAPSGLSAISTVNLALLEQGDEVLIPENVYGPSKALASNTLKKMGISFTIYDPLNPQDLANKLSPRSKLVWLEAAGSITMEFPGLLGLIEVCQAKNVLIALDNTWGAGLAFNPFALGVGHDEALLGVDISIHALTKYPSGGGDILMGSICSRDKKIHKAISNCHMHLGIGVGMNDVEAVLRNLPSIELRYRAQDTAARQLASYLQKQPQVAQVLHPALPGGIGHDNWLTVCSPLTGKAQDGLAAGIFSFIPDPGWDSKSIDTFCESLKLFKLGYSWGGPTSLVMAYNLHAERKHSEGSKRLAGHHVIRLCIGLENVDDLQKDIEQALQAVKKH